MRYRLTAALRSSQQVRYRNLHWVLVFQAHRRMYHSRFVRNQADEEASSTISPNTTSCCSTCVRVYLLHFPSVYYTCGSFYYTFRLYATHVDLFTTHVGLLLHIPSVYYTCGSMYYTFKPPTCRPLAAAAPVFCSPLYRNVQWVLVLKSHSPRIKES